MSNKFEDIRNEIGEHLSQILQEIVTAKSPEDISAGTADEFSRLIQKLAEMETDQPSDMRSELIKFADQLKARQGTKMIDFKALYARCDELDRKLL